MSHGSVRHACDAVEIRFPVDERSKKASSCKSTGGAREPDETRNPSDAYLKHSTGKPATQRRHKRKRVETKRDEAQFRRGIAVFIAADSRMDE
ncbi:MULTISPECIES: hypothetical protein [unclassified Burkholderia]|uniref:hypothetical protein n=1 Tax=unclassified Burkholderia TaxID=2613784 RepID=UPI0015C64FEC|nr:MULTISPECIES: hypothetical protein [unclassified Burkholderia]